MRIGIFETDHFEGAYPVIKLFDNGKNEITIVTYEKSYRQFQFLFKGTGQKYNWIIKTESESKYHFIYRLYKISKKNKFDILYLNTITNNHIFYAVMVAALRKMRIIMTLHDINGYFSFKRRISIRSIIRYTGKRCLIKMLKEFNVVSSTMVDHLKSRLPKYKKVHCVPGSVFEETNRRNTGFGISDHIKIVIPGTIDVRRRNYEFVFDLLERINQKNLNVSITLLGGINDEYGRPIFEKCKQYASKKNNLKFFDTNIVDQPEFDRFMDEAHVVFIPSVINTVISDGVAETYGKSISSGNIFDVIKHAKPFIIPVELQIPHNLQSSSFKYSTPEDIADFLQELLANPDKYITLKEQALQNSKEYTIEKIRQDNFSLFIS